MKIEREGDRQQRAQKAVRTQCGETFVPLLVLRSEPPLPRPRPPSLNPSPSPTRPLSLALPARRIVYLSLGCQHNATHSASGRQETRDERRRRMRCPLASHIAGTAGNDNSANAPGNSTVKSYSNFKCDISQHDDVVVAQKVLQII